MDYLVAGLLLGCALYPVLWIYFDDKEHTKTMRAHFAAQEAYYAQRDPHCDSCAHKEEKEPLRPVIRCAKCMTCTAGLVGDPLFGFDFEKYKSTEG